MVGFRTTRRMVAVRLALTAGIPVLGIGLPLCTPPTRDHGPTGTWIDECSQHLGILARLHALAARLAVVIAEQPRATPHSYLTVTAGSLPVTLEIRLFQRTCLMQLTISHIRSLSSQGSRPGWDIGQDRIAAPQRKLGPSRCCGGAAGSRGEVSGEPLLAREPGPERVLNQVDVSTMHTKGKPCRASSRHTSPE